MKNRIESIKVRREVDQDPDLSYLGEYSQQPGMNAIDREERGDRSGNEYRYCNITMSGEETGNPGSVEQDYQRLEAYNRGAWCMMGVYAEAEVIISGTVQRLRSGGLWGIESDSEPSHFEEVARDELASLSDVLESAGFSKAQIKAAMPADVTFAD